jgi:uncharacterized membrane protein
MRNTASPTPNRYAVVDMLRGLAVVWMTIFHLCFDLQYFGYLRTNFHSDPFWTLQRATIVSLFVFCAGLGQAIAVSQGQSWSRFWKRWRQIAICALLVSVGSYGMFPDSFIYFGILHGMALMLIVARLMAGAGSLLWLWGALALVLPWLALQLHTTWPAADFLNGKAFNWLGLVSHKPITEDYAPLFPWLGVMCLGLAVGQGLLRHHAEALERVGLASSQSVIGAPLCVLSWLGHHSLGYYMLHQPVLIGALSLLALLR